MVIIRICRFLRHFAMLIAIAGFLSGYGRGIKAGIVLYGLSCCGTLFAIESIFMTADEQLSAQLGGKNEQKSDGVVGKGDVPKTGS